MSTLFIGLDDTDILTSPGTGRLARELAAGLLDRFPLIGVTRHQLLNDPRVPMTAKNSANVIHLHGDGAVNLTGLADDVANWMLARFQPGSDPGLCIAMNLPPDIAGFGRRAQTTLLVKAEARQLADAHGLILRELGGTGGGIIGALAAVGLASSGQDGRFIAVGQIRDLRGVQPVETILAAGVAAVQTAAGEVINHGMVDTGDKVRPALWGGQPVLLVEPVNGLWRAIRRD